MISYFKKRWGYVLSPEYLLLANEAAGDSVLHPDAAANGW